MREAPIYIYIYIYAQQIEPYILICYTSSHMVNFKMYLFLFSYIYATVIMYLIVNIA